MARRLWSLVAHDERYAEVIPKSSYATDVMSYKRVSLVDPKRTNFDL